MEVIEKPLKISGQNSQSPKLDNEHKKFFVSFKKYRLPLIIGWATFLVLGVVTLIVVSDPSFRPQGSVSFRP